MKVRLLAREVIMGSWGSLFYAQHHQQSLEIGTSIASCQSLHRVGNTHILMVNIQLHTFLGRRYLSYGHRHIVLQTYKLSLMTLIMFTNCKTLACCLYFFFKMNMSILESFWTAFGLFLTNFTIPLLLVGLTSCCCF